MTSYDSRPAVLATAAAPATAPPCLSLSAQRVSVPHTLPSADAAALDPARAHVCGAARLSMQLAPGAGAHTGSAGSTTWMYQHPDSEGVGDVRVCETARARSASATCDACSCMVRIEAALYAAVVIVCSVHVTVSKLMIYHHEQMLRVAMHRLCEGVPDFGDGLLGGAESSQRSKRKYLQLDAGSAFGACAGSRA